MENCAVRGKLTVRRGRRILREDYPASRLCPSSLVLCPISYPLLSSQDTEENVHLRELMVFSFFHMLHKKEN